MSHAYNVLFLCTGNSARSILAEALLNREGAGRFRRLLGRIAFPKVGFIRRPSSSSMASAFTTARMRSKSWDEFAVPGAPEMDFIFTVCDEAAGETCPIWPGHPMTAHWGIADPAAVEGERQRRGLRTGASLPAETVSACSWRCRSRRIDAMSLQNRLAEIGRTKDTVASLG